MKKRIYISLIVLITCICAIFFVNKFVNNITEEQKKSQSNDVVKHEDVTQNSEESSNKKDNSNNNIVPDTPTNTPSTPNVNSAAPKESSQNTNSTTNNTTNNTVKKTETINFTIEDTINNKVLLSSNVNYNGETVSTITMKELENKNIIYKAIGSGNSMYFSMIGGLKERANGNPLSGWCYFVNGVKLSVGSGQCKLNKDDKLEWKYLKDGMSK